MSLSSVCGCTPQRDISTRLGENRTSVLDNNTIGGTKETDRKRPHHHTFVGERIRGESDAFPFFMTTPSQLRSVTIVPKRRVRKKQNLNTIARSIVPIPSVHARCGSR
jgi:hypothetical protein